MFHIEHVWQHLQAIQGTFRDKRYKEPGLEAVSDTRWYRKLFVRRVFFHKIINNLSPTYLTASLSNKTLPYFYNTRISYQICFRNKTCRKENFKIHFTYIVLVSKTN